MSEDEKTKSLFVKVVNSLAFVFGQKPKSMYRVLNDLGSFDELLVLALAAGDMGLDVYEAHLLCRESKELEEKLIKEKEELKKKRGEVIHLWKHQQKGSYVATAKGSKETF